MSTAPTKSTNLGRRLSQLLSKVKPGRRFVILTHNNPDPDSLASGMALRALVNEKLGVDATLAYGGILGRAENQAMVRLLQIELCHVREVDLKGCAVALVDTQPHAGNNSLPSAVVPDIVIDHHPLRRETRSAGYYDVREDYGATSTIMLEYLAAAGMAPATNLATALFYAIKSETLNLVREVYQPDLEAYLNLYPAVERSLLIRIERAAVPREYYHAFHVALENSYVCGKVVISRLSSVRNPDMVSEIADFLLRLRGTQWTLAMAMYGNDLVLSTRTVSLDHDAGMVMQQVVGDYGTAGGHDTMAGGQIHIAKLNKRAIEQLEQELTDRFLHIVLGEDADRVVYEPLVEKDGK